MNVSARFDVAGYGVIVTGGASGLGLAYGEVLAAHGARVTLIDVDGDGVAARASQLRGQGLDVRAAVADVTDHLVLDRTIDEAAEAYGRLDVAFANAGIDPGVGFVGAWSGGQRPRVDEGALEQWDASLADTRTVHATALRTVGVAITVAGLGLLSFGTLTARASVQNNGPSLSSTADSDVVSDGWSLGVLVRELAALVVSRKC